ncbi:HEAT repeat domain-containing protein [Spirulina subsalsa FACHB-351]|uniref:HEAT repeat domain-containing protein n=1 Tax=Spirulina subsalsa FACHB-351 TaxID=234711 RepID=A0ABT3L4H0_9CYAN|nr:HEAT repeat domain-containing protein [Spirulina subsalsa]MCW6036406.1 HEAT repeat domain-containing protein [Spirulina subsalsa FACHB-351]
MEQGVEGLTVEQAIANLQQTEDLGLRYYAAWWLGKFRVAQPEAIDTLLIALEDEADRSPDGGYPLRRNAARALGKLNEPRVVPALIHCLDCPDYYVREAAAQALEQLGDKSCVSALVNLLAGGVEAAVPVPGKPHLVQPYEAILEALGTLGARETVPLMQPFLTHPVVKVQLAAARALYQLTQEPQYGERLVQGLQADKLPLRRSALIDLGAVGYLPGADAIAQTLAENSLKVISLKGLLEFSLRDLPSSAETWEFSPESVHIMQLMDGLL